MKIFGYNIYIFNPFKKGERIERILGYTANKDWHHSSEFTIRFSVLDVPHVTICHAYTSVKNKEYVEIFIDFRSKSYMEKCSGLSFYEYRKYVQGIDEGRNSCG